MQKPLMPLRMPVLLATLCVSLVGGGVIFRHGSEALQIQLADSSNGTLVAVATGAFYALAFAITYVIGSILDGEFAKARRVALCAVCLFALPMLLCSAGYEQLRKSPKLPPRSAPPRAIAPAHPGHETRSTHDLFSQRDVLHIAG